ncbi:hypothetical protein [uncultured Pelagimonas sp.]|uniref:hypothetical protein n=1 Tax=uncultured Pelagimonas sp. TaxID=1618102 RepID=UPI002639C433|nr:hypothetical protein [uncultured Pelagimonas sp.]
MPFSRPIIEIINEASVTASLPELDAVYGSATKAAPVGEIGRRLKSVVNDACYHLNREVIWAGAWRTAEFTVPAGTQGVPYPNDMDRIRSSTFYNKASPFNSSHGNETAQNWRAQKALPVNTMENRWRLGADRILMNPVPDEEAVFTFEYVSGWPIVDPEDHFKPSITQDTDRVIFDENVFKLELKWRILREFGEAFNVEQREAVNALDRRKAQEQAGGPITYGTGGNDGSVAGFFASNSVVLG